LQCRESRGCQVGTPFLGRHATCSWRAWERVGIDSTCWWAAGYASGRDPPGFWGWEVPSWLGTGWWGRVGARVPGRRVGDSGRGAAPGRGGWGFCSGPRGSGRMSPMLAGRGGGVKRASERSARVRACGAEDRSGSLRGA